jgi:hypothetical protein
LAPLVVNRFTFLGLVCALAVFGLGLLVFALADSSGNAPSVEAAATTPPSPPAATAPEAPEATPTATATATPETRAAGPLQRAAKAAGCTLQSPPNEGAEHVARQTTIADYGSNPPTSGIHHPVWAEDGIYPRERTPGLAHTVHALEHGRVNVQYSQDASTATVDALTRFVEDEDHHMLLFHNQTDMPFEVAATAWDQLIGCKTFNAKTLKALAEFRDAYIDKGPETRP